MKWLITGGAGFIGCNTAARLLETHHEVVLLDNLSRPGTHENLKWLKNYGTFEFIAGDIRNDNLLQEIFQRQDKIDVALHLAAQVAVTTSVANPREDLEVNLLGTFNLCEALRKCSPSTFLLNVSTNKVYGKLENISVVERNGHYVYRDFAAGISEDYPVDFHSPYGCSKGGAEQYVHDYSRIYGLKTVSFRQSCVYGTRQFGIEDQGWVAWLMIAAVTGQPITIYGDGKQIRDLLWIGDLTDCYFQAVDHIEKASGQIYNLGGGPENVLSPLELVAFLEEHLGQKMTYNFSDWRPGDQRVYVSNIAKAIRDFHWKPKTAKKEGLLQLLSWVKQNKELFHAVQAV